MQVPECLDNISPTWAMILREHEADEIVDYVFDKRGKHTNVSNMHSVTSDKYLDMDNFACCIVGECWLGSKAYQELDNGERCNECTTFSMMFPDRLAEMIEDIDREDEPDDSYLSSDIQDFCNHIKKKHPELIRGKEECKT